MKLSGKPSMRTSARGESACCSVRMNCPKELRAIIEFMNEKMETVEVLGVELRQYAGEGVRALVPRIIGQTEATRIAKRKPSALRPRLNEVTFPKVCPALALECFTDALREAGKRGLSVKWATQSFGLGLPLGRKYATLLTAWVDREPAMVQCYLQGVGDKQMRQEVRQRFLDLGRFRSSGEYTAELQLTDLEAVEVTREGPSKSSGKLPPNWVPLRLR